MAAGERVPRPGRRSVSRMGVAALLAAAVLVLACRDDPAGPLSPRGFNPDWTEATHGRGAPDYAVVFPQEGVNTLEITMTAAQWSAIRANMRLLWGFDFGAGGVGAPGGFPATNPEYQAVTATFNGKVWKKAGFRLKGNSSLSTVWRQGIYKLPFRLNFDRFEDDYPAIRNQRFHGFKEISFSPGFADNSLMREKVAADLFRAAGVPAARTAFYRVFIDFGAGPRYCGVYTAVEVIDDTMVPDQFGEKEGNTYKPTSRFQSFVPTQFEKKNNKSAADYSDVQAAIAALHSPLRTTDPPRWRAGLEATFDADHFLRWLAANNAMVNWDAYGVIAHNYYLYQHSSRGLVWIPWDHNLALAGNPGLTADPAAIPRLGVGLSLTMNEVGPGWPLIRFLADDPVYYARYRAHMKAFVQEVFTEGAMDALLERYHALISPHVLGPNGKQPGYTFLPGPAAFTASLGQLKAHVRNRTALVATFVP